MADEIRCPQCGAVLAEGARPGLCLRCLMLNALENQTGLPGDGTQTADPGATGSGQSLEGTEPDPGVTRELAPRRSRARSRNAVAPLAI